METQVAKLRYLRISPRKIRLVANLIKGMPVDEAEAELMLNPKRPSQPLRKLLLSAVANAKNNKHLDVKKLFIKEIRVDQGPTLKRFMPRAMGRATPIQKKTSHITLVLGEFKVARQPRFIITKPEKKIKPVKKGKTVREKPAPKIRAEEQAKSEKPGFMRRIFRRKSV